MRKTNSRDDYAFGVEGPFPHNLYTLALDARWERHLGSSYETEVFMSPTLENASENTIGFEDLKFAGGGLMRRRDVGRLDIGLGAAWTRVYGRGLLLPLLKLGVKTMGDRLFVHALLPLEASVEFAREAAIGNGCAANIVLQAGDGYAASQVARRAPFDLVMANILANPLIAMAGDLAGVLAPGGNTILSGLLVEQASAVIAAHEAAGLTLVHQHDLRGWTALVMPRPA